MVLILVAVVVLPLMADLADNPGKRRRKRGYMLVVRVWSSGGDVDKCDSM